MMDLPTVSPAATGGPAGTPFAATGTVTGASTDFGFLLRQMKEAAWPSRNRYIPAGYFGRQDQIDAAAGAPEGDGEGEATAPEAAAAVRETGPASPGLPGIAGVETMPGVAGITSSQPGAAGVAGLTEAGPLAREALVPGAGDRVTPPVAGSEGEPGVTPTGTCGLEGTGDQTGFKTRGADALSGDQQARTGNQLPSGTELANTVHAGPDTDRGVTPLIKAGSQTEQPVLPTGVRGSAAEGSAAAPRVDAGTAVPGNGSAQAALIPASGRTGNVSGQADAGTGVPTGNPGSLPGRLEHGIVGTAAGTAEAIPETVRAHAVPVSAGQRQPTLTTVVETPNGQTGSAGTVLQGEQSAATATEQVTVLSTAKEQPTVQTGSHRQHEPAGTGSGTAGSAQELVQTRDAAGPPDAGLAAPDSAMGLNEKGPVAGMETVRYDRVPPEPPRKESGFLPEWKPVGDQIVDRVVFNLRSGRSEIHIQLWPETLGKVTFSVMVQDGQILANINADSSQVRSLIESNLTELKQAFADQGLQVSYLGVGDQKDNCSRNNWGTSRSRNPGGLSEQVAGALPEGHPVSGTTVRYHFSIGHTIDLTA